MVQIVNQTSEVPTPGIRPYLGISRLNNRPFNQAAGVIGSLFSQAAQNNASTLRLQQQELSFLKDRAFAEATVGQIDSALSTLAEKNGLTPDDVSALKDSSRLQSKLQQLRVQKPASSIDNIRRIALVRQQIAENPIAAPEIMSAFGLATGDLGEKLDELFDDADRETEVRQQLILEERQRLGDAAFNLSDDQIMLSLQKRQSLLDRAERVQKTREALDNEFRIRNINAFQEEELTTAQLTTAENEIKMELINESRDLFVNDESVVSRKEALRRAREVLGEFDPDNPDEGWMETVLADANTAVTEWEAKVRKELGPFAKQEDIEAHTWYQNRMVEIVEGAFRGEISKDAAVNAVKRIEAAATLDLFNKYPALRGAGYIADKYGELLDKNYVNDIRIERVFGSLLLSALEDAGAQVGNRTGGLGEVGDKSLVEVAKTVNMSTDEIRTLLKDQAAFLNKVFTTAGIDPQDEEALKNITRSTILSAAGKLDMDVMDALLPLFANKKAMTLLETDPELADALVNNLGFYADELSQSINEDLEGILDVSINLEGIPPLFGIRKQIPTLGEFAEISVDDEATVTVDTVFDTTFRDNGTVVITSKYGKDFNLNKPRQLKFLTETNRYIENWQKLYQPRLRYLAQFLADQSDYTAKEIAESIVKTGKWIPKRELPDNTVNVEVVNDV